MDKNNSLKLNTFLNLLRTILRLLFPLVTFPYVTRILSPEGIGKVNFANSIISYFSMIASLGIGSYGLRETAKLRNDKIGLSKFTKEMLIINFISTLFAYLFFAISLFTVSKFSNYKNLLIICSSSILLTTVGIEWLFSGLEQYKYITARSIVFQIISLISIFVFIKNKDHYLRYAVIGIISNVGANICNIFYIHKFVDLKIRIKLDIKKHLKPIFLLFFSSLAITIFSMLDTTMLGFLSTDTEVGYYSAASKVIRMIRDLFPAITTVLFARISYYVAENSQDKIKQVTETVFNFFYLLSLPIIVGLIILLPTIIPLFCGTEFLPAVKTSQIMAPMILFSAISGYLSGSILLSYGKDKQYLFIEMGAAITDIILNFILIPNYKAFGAALATLITEVLMFIAFHFSARNYIKDIKMFKNLIQYFLASLLMGLVVFIIHRYINQIALKLSLSILSGIVTYFIVLILFKNNFVLKALSSIRTPTNHTEV